MPKANHQSKSKLKNLNETGKRKESEERRKNTVPVATERRKVQRRRQIDPTTCEREYNEMEIEFMQALDEYKRSSGRMFPTCSEILEVFLKLGYRKVNHAAGLDHGSQPIVAFDQHGLNTGDHSPLGLS